MTGLQEALTFITNYASIFLFNTCINVSQNKQQRIMLSSLLKLKSNCHRCHRKNYFMVSKY